MGQKNTKILKLQPKTLKELQETMDNEFTDEEILTWFQDYIKYVPKGRSSLDRTAFYKVYNSMFTGDATAFADQVFSTFDYNGNGEVDFKEFMVGLYTSGSKDMATKLEWAFNMYDIDKDGFITRDEMIYVIEAFMKMTQDNLPPEFESPAHMTDVIFEKLDKNGDNKVSKEEFVEEANNIPAIVSILEPNPVTESSETKEEEKEFTDILKEPQKTENSCFQIKSSNGAS